MGDEVEEKSKGGGGGEELEGEIVTSAGLSEG